MDYPGFSLLNYKHNKHSDLRFLPLRISLFIKLGFFFP